MNDPTRRTLRRSTARAVSGTLATTLTASGAVLLLGAPAQAAEAPELTWEVSQQFADHLSTHTLGGGATENEDGVVTFPGGEGDYDPADGSASVEYDGSVKGAFAIGPTEYYQVTFAEPAIEIDDTGAGELTAVVSSSNAAAGGSPAASTDPARVLVATFDAAAGDWAAGELGSLTATPDWAGVLPAGSQEAQDLGMAEGRPVDGQSFAPTFLHQTTSGVRAHFFASGSSSDANKAPAPFTAQAAQAAGAAPTVDVDVARASYQRGLELDVTGSGFSGVTNPGDDGVYVGLAESGGLPDVSDPGGQSAFAASAWVPAAQMADGEIDVDLTAAKSKLERGTSYAVYTWQAHGHSNTTQDTETAVRVPWKKLRAPTTTTATVAKKPTPKRTGKLTVVVKGAKGSGKAAGDVKVALAKNGKVRKTLPAKSIVRPKVGFTLPKLAKGTWTVKATYSGSGDHRPGQASRTFKVRR